MNKDNESIFDDRQFKWTVISIVAFCIFYLLFFAFIVYDTIVGAGVIDSIRDLEQCGQRHPAVSYPINCDT